MSDNPFAPPETAEFHEDVTTQGGVLAGRWTRLGASMIDGILIMIMIIPVYVLTGYIERIANQQVSFIEQLLMAVLGMGSYLLIHGYTLVTRGQSIGKIATGIQIVDVDTNELLPFLRVYIYRYLWTLPLILLIMFIPGTSDDFLLNIVMLIDALMIFGAARRCLHDYIAGSKVVLYRPDR